MEKMTTDGELVETDTMMGTLLKAETDVQIATAHAWPRSIKSFQTESVEMATLNDEIAGECIYALKRTSKDGETVIIEGPSARFAEIIASAWGNCRCGARIVSDDEKFITAQGVFADLQRNVVVTMEVRRRITGKNGRRYGDDMVGVTGNAACAIAIRNAVLKGIPKGFWQLAYDEAKKKAIGDVELLSVKRQKMVAYFGKMGVDPQQIATFLEIATTNDISTEQLSLLRGIATRIKDEEITINEAFRIEYAPDDDGYKPGTMLNIKVLAAELLKCETIGDCEACSGVFADQATTDDECEFIHHATQERIKEIKSTRGANSNTKETK